MKNFEPSHPAPSGVFRELVIDCIAGICDPNGGHFGPRACGHSDLNPASRTWPLGCVPNGGSFDGMSAPPGFIDEALEDAYAAA